MTAASTPPTPDSFVKARPGARDVNALIFVSGGLVWLATIMAWVCFPQYRLSDLSVAHRPVWAPPMIKIVTGYDRLNEEDFQRLQISPEVRAQLEAMRQWPPRPAEPSWLGYDPIPDEKKLNAPLRVGKRMPPNRLLHLMVVVGLMYWGLLRYRGIL